MGIGAETVPFHGFVRRPQTLATQPDTTSNTLENSFDGVINIHLDGVSASSFAHGITLAGSNSVLCGASITAFGTTGTMAFGLT